MTTKTWYLVGGLAAIGAGVWWWLRRRRARAAVPSVPVSVPPAAGK